jgi:basic amino acid/polyamine antiporter, APA family
VSAGGTGTLPPPGGQPPLKRAIGPGLLILFVIGDILGTGIYAVTGKVAGKVGGALWLPFVIGFAVAFLTAASYVELVGKYPRAAGAALYTQRAFKLPFLTFIVAFMVMCSGLSSASAAARAFSGDYLSELTGGVLPPTLIAILFIVALAALSLRGVSESVKANVVLTLVELSGLLLVILIGFYAFFGDDVDFSRVVAFDTPEDKNVFLAVTTATSLAFFAMVGFEDSVNMAEETQDPSRIFPKMMLTGLSITGGIYVLVSICAVALVPIGTLEGSDTPLLEVVNAGAPDLPMDEIFPIITMFAVANSALINMLMASRLLYGMARQAVLPPVLGKVHAGRRTPWVAIIFTTVLALALIAGIGTVSEDAVATLGGTTSLLLLAVFTVVNIACLVLRRDDRPTDRTPHYDPTGTAPNPDHFRAPTILPIVGAIACLYLVTPASGRASEEYVVAAWLMALGVVLWAITWFSNRALRAKRTFVQDPSDLGG